MTTPNTTYLLKTGNRSSNLISIELPKSASSLATDVDGNIISGSGGGGGSYLPLSGGLMDNNSIIKWFDYPGPSGGLQWYKPDGTTLMAELLYSRLRLSNPILDGNAPSIDINASSGTPSMSLTLGLPQGQQLNWAYTANAVNNASFNQIGNAFSVDCYGLINARTGSMNYYSLGPSSGFTQLVNSGVNKLTMSADNGIQFTVFNSEQTDIVSSSLLTAWSLEIGNALRVSHSTPSSININANVMFNDGAIISYVNNFLITLPNSTLGTDNNGKIINIRENNERIVEGIAEVFLDDDSLDVVAYNLIFELATPVNIKKGDIVTLEVFGSLSQINTSLVNTAYKVGYNTSTVTYGSINLKHRDISLFIADSSTSKGMTVTCRQSMVNIVDGGTGESLHNLKWEIAYIDDTFSGQFDVIDSSNSLVVIRSGSNSKLIPFGLDKHGNTIGVFNDKLISNKFDRISIGIFTGFGKMDIIPSCSEWSGLPLSTVPVKIRIKIE